MRKWRKNNPEEYAIELKRNREYRAKHRKMIDDYNHKYYQLHSEERKAYIRAYGKTKKGKEVSSKHTAKRKRELGWILMFSNPFVDSVAIDYHHITDAYVVAIPRTLHRIYNTKHHREKVMEIVKQIYL